MRKFNVYYIGKNNVENTTTVFAENALDAYFVFTAYNNDKVVEVKEVGA